MTAAHSNGSGDSTVELKLNLHDEGRRLDVVLAERLQVSRARAQKLLAAATVNGRTVRSSRLAAEGDVLLLAPDHPDGLASTSIAAGAGSFAFEVPPIIFEDEHLLVVNKPRGLSVHPGAGEPRVTLVDILRQSGRSLSTVGPAERAGIVHRLDMDTSGLMIVAKTDEAHWKLAADFEARRVRKTYAAVICGVPLRDGRIDAPIKRHPVNRKKMAVSAAGRPAVTEYHLRRTWPQFALLDVNLLTGRTHQIRVHLAYVQHPVAGDHVYGGHDRALQLAPTEEVRHALELLNGQALHAWRLKFNHPLSGQAVELEADMPEAMTRLIAALGS